MTSTTSPSILPAGPSPQFVQPEIVVTIAAGGAEAASIRMAFPAVTQQSFSIPLNGGRTLYYFTVAASSLTDADIPPPPTAPADPAGRPSAAAALPPPPHPTPARRPSGHAPR